MTTPPAPPGAPPAEVSIDDATVARLIAEQFPALAELPLTFFASGWDNTTYRLGSELAVRLPRLRVAVDLLVKEQTFLPRLAPHVDVAVPVPLHVGAPSSHYPWPFSIVPWRVGTDCVETPLLPSETGKLGRFLRALHGCDASGLTPIAWRGGPLRDRAAEVRERLRALRGYELPVRQELDRAAERFERGVDVPIDTPRCWIHGDLHPKNVISSAGTLSSVIDWGDMNLGDPAGDLACAWMLFDPEHHAEFWCSYGAVSAATRERALGWASFFGVTLLLAGLGNQPEFMATGSLIIQRISRE
jgi:aminoglycoside phosphotransferase (APT) family kinase protein